MTPPTATVYTRPANSMAAPTATSISVTIPQDGVTDCATSAGAVAVSACDTISVRIDPGQWSSFDVASTVAFIAD